MTGRLASAHQVLAQATPHAAKGEGAKAGPIGLAVILLLCIACYFLFKSMSKHMREVRENFPGQQPARPVATAAPGTTSAERARASIARAQTIPTSTGGQPEQGPQATSDTASDTAPQSVDEPE